MAGKRILFKLVEREGEQRILIEAIDYLGNEWLVYKKSIAGARFAFDAKEWLADADHATKIAQRLDQAGFSVVMNDAVRVLLNKEVGGQANRIDAARAQLAMVDSLLKNSGKALRPFQRKDVLWLASRKKAINCNDMGLGKTIETLCVLPPAKDARVLICGPKVSKGVWKREAKTWRPDYEKVEDISGRGNFRLPERGEIIITNYDILPDIVSTEKLKQLDDLVVVGDEIHMLKNPRSKRAKRFEALAKMAAVKMGLTGTPLPNRPQELWAILKLLDLAHEAFGSYKEFIRCFDGVQDKWGTVKWGEPIAECAERLRPVLVRHLKEDVLQELPGKTYRTIEVDLDDAERKMLDIELTSLGKSFLKAKDLSEIPFADMSKCRSLLAKVKAQAAIEFVEEHEEANRPLIVFSMHRYGIDMIGKRPGWATITGDTKHRNQIEEDFQGGMYKGIAATIQAAATALTLTRAGDELFIDRSYVPADNDQAEDRAHRYGQTKGLVITDLVVDHPIDRHVHALIVAKRKINEASIEQTRQDKVDDTFDMSGLTLAVPALKLDPTPYGNKRRPSANALEKEAARVILKLSGLNESESKSVAKPPKTFDYADRRMGRDIALDLLVSDHLTDGQWRVVLSLGRKYAKRQLQ